MYASMDVLEAMRKNTIKTEFTIRNVRVQVYTDRSGVEVHVLGKEQSEVETGKFHFEAINDGDQFLNISPVTGENESEYLVFCAVESLILGTSEYNMLARIGHDIPNTAEFDRLYHNIRLIRQEMWEFGILLPTIPFNVQMLSLEQVMSLAPMLGAPDIQYNEHGAITRVDYGNIGYAILDHEDSVRWDGDRYDVMYLWRKKKHG